MLQCKEAVRASVVRGRGRKRERRQGRGERVSSRQRWAKASKFKMFLKVIQIDCKNI